MVAAVWSKVSGQGSDIVVLHGWGLNANIWTPVAKPLSELGRLHQIDLPGYGESAWPETLPITFTNLVELTLAALPARCHLVGWSLGGLVATQIALQAPERVQSLTTVASSPYFPAADGWPGIDPHILNNFARLLSKDFRKTVERFLALQSMGSPHAKEDVRQVKTWLFEKPMASVEVLDAGLDILATVDLRDQLKHIDLPFFRLYGRLDALVPASVADQVQALAPASSQFVSPRCSHAPFISDPTTFAQQISAFISNNS